ncbi:MAG TPA: 4-phosphoerythronate dehydrogenase PdxB [Prolixibacteraceae bacterium]|nr:4-phosphoerythronate dehydrogenase PdxB [Prolixibacteraceae bacterium]HPS12478.1 4-phosphoerythronate dehydrogenase PdxB [Prolixibacteraceae bacterium]
MKIVIDNKIPYIKGALEPFAEVVYLPGKDTTPDVVRDADAIITRTRTRCNEALLAGSQVKMIATATIGYDHIDTAYCEKAGIEWTNAPGCNSWSVVQYFMAAIYALANEKKLTLSEMTIGIIGAGNVGSKVARFCSVIGMNVLVNDPPRQRKEGDAGFVSLDEIQQKADIITIHTPLTYEGEDKTFHLIDETFLEKCENNIFLFNLARGEVAETKAIIDAIKMGKVIEAIIDCWENEPEISLELLDHTFISTPHIAGYSRDGKANGTSMSVQAISRKFGLGIDQWECQDVELPANTLIQINGERKTDQEIVAEAVLKTYPIMEDNNRLKFSPITFEKQRGDYPVRREFPIYNIEADHITLEACNMLKGLGFQI